MNDSIEDKRERENREFFESLAKVVHIILTKCNRCNPTYGCMGCEFDPLGGPIVPLVEEAFLSFADHHNVPPHLEHLYRKILSHSKKRDTFLK